ncbi:MAG: glycoside hydrolase family 2 TIM barrel-domain containing protein [Huintestinicola sp.]
MKREQYPFNDDWRFTKMPLGSKIYNVSVTDHNYDDSNWEQVTLPHTWNADDGASGRTGICEGGENYYRGLACYRKHFYCDDSGRRFFIEFGAANTIADVYVNGHFAGRHEGGYSAFRFDITEHIISGENVIAVKVSNAPTNYIAPITDQGDFTKMGGLYREVQLIMTEQAHIELLDHGSTGIYITPHNISESKADIELLVKLKNDDMSQKSLTVTAEISDMQNNAVGTAAESIFMSAGSQANVKLAAEILSPILWNSKKNPHLYTARIIVSENDEIIDEKVQTFGIRTYYVDREKGFFLNGEYLDLHGVNYHQDSYENGWAMTDEQRERDYKLMLDMGCTTVRMAHYQHCEQEYDLCDRYGLLVWTEIGIVNKVCADQTDEPAVSDSFAENSKQQLTELIRQNYNHPSIILWGISNELHQMNNDIYDLYCELSDIVKKEDKTRLRTAADNQFYGEYLKLPVDVIGYNRYFGWYKEAGPAEKFGEWLDLYHKEKAVHPISISEYGGGAAITQHKDNIDWENEIDPWGKRHYENYQSEMHEKIWAQLSKRQYLWGKYIWCMFDFASDGREEGDTKGQNDKGIVTRERVPKDTYFFYRSVWSKEKTVYIAERRHDPRPCNVPYVKVYSNAEKAELSINGASAGTLCKNDLPKDQDTVFLWKNIIIEKNRKNIILVKAEFDDGSVKSDTITWTGE